MRAAVRLGRAMRERYTRYPRPILWLIPGSETGYGGIASPVEPFYLSKLPVSNEQFEAFDPGYRRSELSVGDCDPAVGVSWQQAEGYCRWYAEVSRKPMRLPTEAEWEHACRAGSEHRFFFGEDPREADLYLWDAANSQGRLRPMDQKKANGFGLFGMLGGVWEWTAAPQQSPPGDSRVLRGGSFRTPREELSCASRRIALASEPVADAGFRITKSLRQ